ncbi:hypothetical protein AB1Y20_018419 [Prymnesium parvum]|uniref:Uncharacterized protein n=1 Tax=Prymnesium parvum TaxID=97485 RepID=A0AB34JPV2_PRYPA
MAATLIEYFLWVCRILLHLLSSLLEAPWLYLENKASLLDPETKHGGSSNEWRPDAEPREGPSEVDYPTEDEPLPFVSTAALLAEREQLQEELRRAEAEEDAL